MAEVKTMDQVLDESMGGDRFGAVLFATFAGVALILAAFGIGATLVVDALIHERRLNV